jgi:hypothetical protein
VKAKLRRLAPPALAILLAVLFGVWIGGGSPAELWRQIRGGGGDLGDAPIPEDPALAASLPVPDPAAGLPPSPLNALLKPELTPKEQTDIIAQLLLDYWTAVRKLPNGTWEEITAQLAGANPKKLALVPPGHPAMSGKDAFSPGKDAPGIRLHVISSSGGAFQLIHNGPDGKPYTDDDQIRNFPPELDFK